ncbi:MAG: hypothetical protein EPO65_11145 [Dehalococcoidia bacterium]|nr:MAG: hypothetical protein EPO65_11145 [Dehalococcoidia bacterium]
MTRTPRSLWARWVAHFVAGELVGLGGVGLIGLLAMAFVPDDASTALQVLLFVLMSASGGLEGISVGWSQHRVLREVLPDVSRRAWILATTAGAVGAWVIGAGVAMSLPSSVDPSDVLWLWAILGVALGAVLGGAQAFALRGHVPAVERWIVANAVGWSAGLAVSFAGIGLASEVPTLLAIPLALVTGALTGIAPGAVTGHALVRYARV